MGADKTSTLGTAADLVTSGTTLYVGGAVLSRKPMAFIRSLAEVGRTDLELITFAGSVDIELLVAQGCVAAVASAYVGLGSAGPAPAFKRAVEDGSVIDREYSEWTMLAGLRAASMGVPFLPTRAALGSQLLDELAPASIDDPYGTGTFLAIPPIRPDVTVLHAWRATPSGVVQFAWPPEHLWDVDVVAARAARRTIVTVEQIIDDATAAAEAQLTALLPLDVHAIIEAPGGSWPTAAPPLHETDHDFVSAYARDGDASLLMKSAA